MTLVLNQSIVVLEDLDKTKGGDDIDEDDVEDNANDNDDEFQFFVWYYVVLHNIIFHYLSLLLQVKIW